MDIKNNNSNKIKLLENSDKYSHVINPKWFRKKEGEGFIIQSFKGLLDLKLECEVGSILKLSFRAIDVKDLNNNRFQIYINYTNISINGKNILENELLSHDNSFVYEHNVDEPFVDIHMEWMPFNRNVVYEDNLKKENNELKSKLKNNNSKKWKLTNFLKGI